MMSSSTNEFGRFLGVEHGRQEKKWFKNSYEIYDTNSNSEIVRYVTYKSILFKRGLHAFGLQGTFKKVFFSFLTGSR